MLRPFTLVIVEAVYFVVYLGLSIDAAGGTSPSDSCPLFLAAIPTWFLLIVAVVVSEDLGTSKNRVIFLLAIVSQYFITLILVLGAFGDTYPRYFANYWPNHAVITLTIIGWYLVGQGFHWTYYLYNLKTHRSEGEFVT